MNLKFLALALLVLPLFIQAQESKPDPMPAASTAAELTLITGSVTAASAAGERKLGKGDAVFAGDTLKVGANSYANLKFLDGGRVLLRPNTDFTVEAYKFTAPVEGVESAPAEPLKGKAKGAAPVQQAFFKLLRGGFRAVSGLIKGDQQSYRVTTPVATIGIRGTDYEVQICAEDCPETPAKAKLEGTELASTTLAGLELAQAGDGANANQGGGVLLATNEGTVVMQTARGEYLIKVGEVAFALTNGQVLMLPSVPDALLYNKTPSPENCQ